MKRLLSFLLITTIFAQGCGSGNGNTGGVFLLDGENLFNPDSVAAFLSTASAKQADSSKKFFLKAVSLFKNKNNTVDGITLFIKALCTYPTASAYYELGDAYLQSGNAASALKSFQMAEKLEYTPFGNVLFKEACCYGQMNDEKMFDYLKYAIENGFADHDKIFTDKSFPKDNMERLRRVYDEAIAGNGDVNAILWQDYSRQFEQVNFPLSIDSGTYKSIGEPVFISYDYDRFITEMRDGKFSRDVGNDFFYVGKVADTATYKTVIYGVLPYEEGGAPAYYYMASFNNQGRLIDKKIVAGAKTFGDMYKVLTIPAGREFTIQEYKNTYLKNTDKDGFQDNEVTSRELVKTTYYSIDTSGKFIEVLAH